MPSHNIKTYLQTLGKNNEYNKLFSRAETFNKMQNTFSAIIPAHLAQSCRLGRLSNKTLTILADSSAIASKLKLISSSLLLQLQKLGWDITAIKVNVQAHYYAHYSTKKTQNITQTNPKPSATGINCLQQLAASLPHSELKQAILSLASKLHNPRNHD